MASKKLSTPTQDTRDIVVAAMKCIERILLDGHRNAKAGIMRNDFTPTGVSQLNLFDETQSRPGSDALMKELDGISHSGQGKV